MVDLDYISPAMGEVLAQFLWQFTKQIILMDRIFKVVQIFGTKRLCGNKMNTVLLVNSVAWTMYVQIGLQSASATTISNTIHIRATCTLC